jgi:putative transposase
MDTESSNTQEKQTEKIRMDNGPEFIANIMQQWSEMHEIEFKYIEPGKPMQNGYIERFNRILFLIL